MDSIKRFLRKAIVSYKALFSILSPQAYITMMIINPVIQLLFFVLIARYVYNATDLSPWIIGNSLVLTSVNSLFGIAPQLSNERSMGTLKHLIASPTGNSGIFLPRALFHMIDGIISVTIGLIAGRIFFGFTIPMNQLAGFYAVVICASLSVMGFGMCISSIGLISRDLNLIINLFTSILIMGTGANIPLDTMPLFIQKISAFLPLTRSIIAARAIQQGEQLSLYKDIMIGEIVLGIIYTILGFMLFILMERTARRQATLDII